MHTQNPVNCAYFCPAELTHADLLQVRLRLELRNKLSRLGPWTLLYVCLHFISSCPLWHSPATKSELGPWES